jgi:hypothetical protein
MARQVLLYPAGTPHPWWGVIIECHTGIVFAHQCGDEAAVLKRAEGYFVPLDGAAAPRLDALRHAGETLPALVAAIGYWPSNDQPVLDPARMHLALDHSRLDEMCEAWVPVITPDGPGVLVWDKGD